jgi:Arc-like DNA binding domain
MPRKVTDTVALQVRMPEGLRRKLAAEAEKSERSLNSEILWRLGQSLGTEGTGFLEQHEVAEEQVKTILDRIVHSPEVHKKLAEQLAESSVFKEWVAKRGKK